MDGHEDVMVVDEEGYQALLDRMEEADLLESLRQGIRDSEAGLGIPLDEARRQLRDKHGF